MTAPTLVPIIEQAGFDPIWFGVVLTINMEIGLITPPVGLNLYVINGIAPDISLPTILKGALPFMADLMRAMSIPVRIDLMEVSSYGGATETTGRVRILKDLDREITGRHVLIVEDIVDSGLTLSYLLRNLKLRGPASLEIATLLLAALTAVPDTSALPDSARVAPVPAWVPVNPATAPTPGVVRVPVWVWAAAVPAMVRVNPATALVPWAVRVRVVPVTATVPVVQGNPATVPVRGVVPVVPV